MTSADASAAAPGADRSPRRRGALWPWLLGATLVFGGHAFHALFGWSDDRASLVAIGCFALIDYWIPPRSIEPFLTYATRVIAGVGGAYLAMFVVPRLLVGAVPTSIAYGAPYALLAALGFVVMTRKDPTLARRDKLWWAALIVLAAGMAGAAWGPEFQ